MDVFIHKLTQKQIEVHMHSAAHAHTPRNKIKLREFLLWKIFDSRCSLWLIEKYVTIVHIVPKDMLEMRFVGCGGASQ